MDNKPTYSVGGQALINGIMMTGPLKTAISVRKPNGEILTTDFHFKRNKTFLRKIPIVRGCISFIESMKIGTEAMNYSAEISMIEEDIKTEMVDKINNTIDKIDTIDEKVQNSTNNKAIKDIVEDITEEIKEELDDIVEEITEEDDDKDEDKNKNVTINTDTNTNTDENDKEIDDYINKSYKNLFDDFNNSIETNSKNINNSSEKSETKKISNKTATVIGSIIGTILGILLSTVLFMWLPSTLYNILPINSDSQLLRSVFEGILKLIIMIGYMVGISYLPDIRKTFQYHGAEHKTIFCYENQLPLTVENVKKQSRFHPRCGTSFLIVSIIIGIVTGMFIPATNPVLRTIIKILILPITMGLSYELIQICGRHNNNFVTKIISAPGLWIQRITTKEPSDDIIEVAIAALNAII